MIEGRIRKLEVALQGMARAPTREEKQSENERLLDERFAKEGTTREAIIAKHGSLAEWAYAKMTEPSGVHRSESGVGGFSLNEDYIAMLDS